MKWFILGLIFYNGDPKYLERVGPYETLGRCEEQRKLVQAVINSVPRTGAMLYCKELPHS